MPSCKTAYLGLPAHDLTGQRFGRLTVVRWISRPYRRGIRGIPRSGWECLCDCGKTTEAITKDLNKGIRFSCGCARRNQIHRRDPDAGIGSIICNYRNSANRRGKSWELSMSAAKALLFADCHYCGAPPTNKRDLLRHTGDILLYNGIDRIDNSLGYIEGNVVSCCHVCNRCKRTTSAADFIAWAKRIAMKHTFPL